MKTYYYAYAPSLAAAAAIAILFAIVTIIHFYQLARTRTWFWLPFFTGGVFEVIGFAARAVNAHQTEYYWTKAPFVVQTLFILLAPVLFAASLYMMLARLALLSKSERTLLIKRTWSTRIFVSCDILSFLVQVVGGVMLTSDSAETINHGKTVVLVGLWMQIAFFGLFITNVSVFWFRSRRQSKQTLPPNEMPLSHPLVLRAWREHVATLLLACTIILIRCVYRVAEYTEGKGGYILSHETFLYVFDAALMLVVMLIFVGIHPSEIVARLDGSQMAVGLKVVKPGKP